MKRSTQTDVARLAGVSRAVVSHVVNNRPAGGITITEETRRRVLAAIEVTGYQPDASAQSLRLGKTRSVGVLIPDTQNPHYWQVVRGVEDAARPHGYDLFFSARQRRGDGPPGVLPVAGSNQAPGITAAAHARSSPTGAARLHRACRLRRRRRRRARSLGASSHV